MTIDRPSITEYASFYAGYVGKVADAGGPLTLLEAQAAVFDLIARLPEAIGDHCYADGKWSVKEVVGHMADTERVFAYRLRRIARADQTALSGFDENAWAAAAPHARRPIAAVAAEMRAVRASTLPLIHSLDATAMANTGTANGKAVSARAICWIMAGHAEHHLGILRERYGVTI